VEYGKLAYLDGLRGYREGGFFEIACNFPKLGGLRM
jgi:hypothetical protein